MIRVTGNYTTLGHAEQEGEENLHVQHDNVLPKICGDSFLVVQGGHLILLEEAQSTHFCSK